MGGTRRWGLKGDCAVQRGWGQGFCFCFCFCLLLLVEGPAVPRCRLGLRLLCWHEPYVVRAVWFLWVFAGIRDSLACFKRRPCAGRHLLFFAAAKKSRQKKAAHTANISSCLRAPNRSLTSHGNHVTHVRCQRSCVAPHPLHAPALRHAVPDLPRPPRWQTMCRP